MQYTRVGRGFQFFCQLELVGNIIWKLLMSRVLGHTKANKNKCQSQVEMFFCMDTGVALAGANATCFYFLILRTSNLRKS